MTTGWPSSLFLLTTSLCSCTVYYLSPVTISLTLKVPLDIESRITSNILLWSRRKPCLNTDLYHMFVLRAPLIVFQGLVTAITVKPQTLAMVVENTVIIKIQ